MMDYYSSYLPTERMNCIYNGVSLPVGVHRLLPNRLEKRLKVVCVGVLCEQKNQLELLRAQAILYERGILIETFFIGSPKADYLQQMEQFIAQKKLSAYAHIVGHTDDVYAALQDMNVGVICAHDEAFGRVTIEEMLMKIPVVVSRSGANTELMRDGIDGKIYPLGDIEALADALQYYTEHPECLELHGNNAYEYAVECFSAERNAEQIYQLITGIK